MKKLLLSCDEYVYSYNGQYYLGEFGSVLVNRYLNVFDNIIFAARTKYVFSKEQLGNNIFPINNDRIEIFPIPFFQGPKEYAKYYLKTKRILKDIADKCDACVFRLPSAVAFACLDIAVKKKLPIGLEIVANPYELKKNTNNLLAKVLMSIWHNNLSKVCKLADAISYVTERSLQSVYPPNSNGFSTYYSSIEMDDSFFFKPRELDSNKIEIAHVSNHIKTFLKGHLSVINTVKLLKDKGFDVVARFAGEGEYINLFMDEAKEIGVDKNIEFVGTLDKNGLKELLLKSNIMIFPSFSEGLPRVLIEAMAAGLPCLSTPVGGIPELLDDYLLLDPNDVIGFANKTEEIFTNSTLYSQLSSDNYNKALEFEKKTLDEKRNCLYRYLYNLSN